MGSQPESLAEAFAAARARWPSIALDADAFAAHVLEHTSSEDHALARIATDDLYLACACARGDAAALAALEPVLESAIEHALRPIRAESDLTDEVRQVLRVQLLVGDPDRPDGRPKIATFAGRSTLERWLRVAATRVALMGLRRDQKRVGWSDEEMLDVPAFAADPEIDYIRRRYGAELRAAFREALTALSLEQRNLLRLTLLHRMTTAQLGVMHAVHRATAARWVASAREAVVVRVLELVEKTLQLTRSELASLARAVRSGFELSLHDIL